jgi:hypothetical protein
MKYFFIIILLFLLGGCATPSFPILFEPISTPSVTTIYTNGVPIAGLSCDSLYFLLSLDEAHIAGTSYFRLWVLTQNLSRSSTLIEPSKTFIVKAKPKKFTNDKSEFLIVPKSPTLIMNDLDNEEAMKTIFTAIGGSLEAMSAKNTKITSNHGDNYQINDVSDKRKVIDQETSNSISSISNWYSLFKSSISSGILRKNTLISNQSVNGYLYFENVMHFRFSSVGVSLGNTVYRSVDDYDFSVVIQLPNGIKEVEFRLIQGE